MFKPNWIRRGLLSTLIGFWMLVPSDQCQVEKELTTFNLEAKDGYIAELQIRHNVKVRSTSVCKDCPLNVHLDVASKSSTSRSWESYRSLPLRIYL